LHFLKPFLNADKMSVIKENSKPIPLFESDFYALQNAGGGF